MSKRHLILLAFLSVIAAWRWGPALASRAILPDEEVYVRAARHLEAGRSIYAEPGYFYPPPIAVTIEALTPLAGEVGALQLLRTLALVGIVLTVSVSLGLVEWSLWLKCALGGLFIAFAPAVEIATNLGNAAGLASGLVILALVGWRERPLLMGLALGVGLAIKPMAPLAPILLVAHRPLGRESRNHVGAAAATLVAASGACWIEPGFLPGLLSNARGHGNPYNFSLHRVLSGVGLELPALVILTAVAAAAIFIVRRRRLSKIALLTIVSTSSLLALPILWAHSLLLLLPVQVLALDGLAKDRLRPIPRLGERGTIAITILAVSATVFAGAVGTTYGLPSWAALLVRLVPLLAIPYLGWFSLASERSGERG